MLSQLKNEIEIEEDLELAGCVDEDDSPLMLLLFGCHSFRENAYKNFGRTHHPKESQSGSEFYPR